MVWVAGGCRFNTSLSFGGVTGAEPEAETSAEGSGVCCFKPSLISGGVTGSRPGAESVKIGADGSGVRRFNTSFNGCLGVVFGGESVIEGACVTVGNRAPILNFRGVTGKELEVETVVESATEGSGVCRGRPSLRFNGIAAPTTGAESAEAGTEGSGVRRFKTSFNGPLGVSI